MIELHRYEPWHYEYLAPIVDPGADLGIVKLFAKMYGERGNAYTIKLDGFIVGVAGVMKMWEGVAEAWTLFSSDARAHAFFLHSRTKAILNTIIANNNFHRVQAIVKATNPVACKWIEALGFKPEEGGGRLKMFGGDRSDHIMYVRFPLEEANE